MSEIIGGIVLEKYILVLKLGNKYNICDRLIFALIQCNIVDGKDISNILDIFPYEIIAESLAKLHNNGLILINLNTGKIQLTSEIQKIIELRKGNETISNDELEEKWGVSGRVGQNFSEMIRVTL